MKRLVLLILVGLFALVGFATAQFYELIYDGGVLKGMCSLPLELNSPAFSKITYRLPQGEPNTALYRKYVGCWKIKNDSLFLDSVLVSGSLNNYIAIFIDDIFATNKTKSGYFANWVSGSLRVVSGERIIYVHSAWESTWENEELITVEKGIVKKRICKHNRVVNEGIIDEMNLRSLMESLGLGELTRRITLEVSYPNFDTKGNPTSCSIRVIRGSGDADTDNRIVTAIKKFMLKNKALPIYYIDDKYISYTYIIPIGPFRKD